MANRSLLLCQRWLQNVFPILSISCCLGRGVGQKRGRGFCFSGFSELAGMVLVTWPASERVVLQSWHRQTGRIPAETTALKKTLLV